MTTVVVSRAFLNAALADATRIVDRKQIIPILGNVRVQVAEGRMTVTATNLEIVWRSTFPVDGDLVGAAMDTTVPAMRLADMLKRAAGDSVTLAVDDKAITVRAGKARWTLPTLPSVDFPDPDMLRPTHSFAMPASDLAAGIAATSYAAEPPGSPRIMLQGVLVDASEGKLHFIATDGHRLSAWAREAPAEADGCPQMIIPSAVAGPIQKLAAAASGDVTVRGCRERLFVEVEIGGRLVHVATKLVDAKYPDWRRLRAQARGVTVYQVDRSMIADATSRVSLSAGDKSRQIAMELRGDAIRLSTRNRDTGEEAEDEVEATGEGDVVRLGLNGVYAAEALSAMPAGKIEIRTGGSAMDPILFAVPANDDRWTIVMPMRVPAAGKTGEAA